MQSFEKKQPVVDELIEQCALEEFNGFLLLPSHGYPDELEDEDEEFEYGFIEYTEDHLFWSDDDDDLSF